MKKRNRSLLGLLALLGAIAFFTGCSKNKDDKTKPEDPTLKVEGEWNLTQVDFLSDAVEWDSDIPFTPGNTVGYAPYMLSQVYGYDFETQKTNNEDLGFKLDVIQGFYTNYDDSKDLWYWNYINDNASVEMVQVNLEFPPYDFGIHNISNIDIEDGGKTLILTAEIQSRKVGGKLIDMETIPVTITLEKGEAVAGVDLLINGAPLNLPEKNPTLKVEGEWNLTQVDFLSDAVEWDSDIPFTPSNTVGYAPYMYSQVYGYDFETQKTNNEDLGFKLDVIQGFYTNYDDSKDLWYWNYINGNASVEMVQVNLEFPPYDFGIHNISNIDIEDGGKTLILTAEIQSRKVGGKLIDMETIPVTITLEKGEAVAGVDLLINGAPFSLPEKN